VLPLVVFPLNAADAKRAHPVASALARRGDVESAERAAAILRRCVEEARGRTRTRTTLPLDAADAKSAHPVALALAHGRKLLHIRAAGTRYIPLFRTNNDTMKSRLRGRLARAHRRLFSDNAAAGTKTTTGGGENSILGGGLGSKSDFLDLFGDGEQALEMCRGREREREREREQEWEWE